MMMTSVSDMPAGDGVGEAPADDKLPFETPIDVPVEALECVTVTFAPVARVAVAVTKWLSLLVTVKASVCTFVSALDTGRMTEDVTVEVDPTSVDPISSCTVPVGVAADRGVLVNECVMISDVGEGVEVGVVIKIKLDLDIGVAVTLKIEVTEDGEIEEVIEDGTDLIFVVFRGATYLIEAGAIFNADVFSKLLRNPRRDEGGRARSDAGTSWGL
jgi:hypothetical protein